MFTINAITVHCKFHFTRTGLSSSTHVTLLIPTSGGWLVCHRRSCTFFVGMEGSHLLYSKNEQSLYVSSPYCKLYMICCIRRESVYNRSTPIRGRRGKINRKHKARVTHDPHPYQYPYRPDYHLDSEQERKSTPLTKNDRTKLDSFFPFFTISYPVWKYTYTPSFGCTSDERFSSLFDMRGGDMKL